MIIRQGPSRLARELRFGLTVTGFGILLALIPGIYQRLSAASGMSVFQIRLTGLALLLFAAALTTLQLMERNGFRVPARPRLGRFHNQPATVISQGSDLLVRIVIAALLLAFCYVAWVWLAAGAPGWLRWGLGFVAGALVLVSIVVLARGSGRAQIVLTPGQVVNYRERARALIGWDQIAALELDDERGTITLRTTARRTIERTSGRRSRQQVPAHLPRLGLPYDGVALAQVLDHYIRDVAARSELGTHASLGTIERLARTSTLTTAGPRAGAQFRYREDVAGVDS